MIREYYVSSMLRQNLTQIFFTIFIEKVLKTLSWKLFVTLWNEIPNRIEIFINTTLLTVVSHTIDVYIF